MKWRQIRAIIIYDGTMKSADPYKYTLLRRIATFHTWVKERKVLLYSKINYFTPKLLVLVKTLHISVITEYRQTIELIFSPY